MIAKCARGPHSTPAAPDTYRLERNVAAQTDKRRKPLPAVLGYIEPHEVEFLAQTLASGDWRTSTAASHDDEIAMQAEEDARDAELVRLLLLSGRRLVSCAP